MPDDDGGADTGRDPREKAATLPAEVVRRAARRALLAPSVHNTQPWRLHVHGGRLDLVADVRRSLPVVDPRRRQLVISCGCALLNARVAVAANGFRARVDRFPDARRPQLVAQVVVTGPADGDLLGTLDDQVAQRHTQRRALVARTPGPELLAHLARAARAEQAALYVVPAEAFVPLLADAVATEGADPDYGRELADWTVEEPGRRDGIPASVLVRPGPGSVARSLAPPGEDGRRLCHLLIATERDDPVSWVHAGEALERVWLELVRHGWAARPVMQVVELGRTRAELRRRLLLRLHPQAVLAIGTGPDDRSVATPRRAYRNVVTESGP